MRMIPTTAAEMNVPDMGDEEYYNSDLLLRRYLRDEGDRRWKLPSAEFEKQFYHSPDNMRNELKSCMDCCSMDAFSAFSATNIAPAATTSNQFVDAISGVISGIGPAVATRITKQPKTALAPAPVARPVMVAAKPWYQNPLVLGGGVALLIGALFLMRK